MFMQSGKHLAQVVASSAFEFWQRKDFRLYVNFQSLSQTEQDRMFNELEVSVLGLFTLSLDYAISVAKEEYGKLLEVLQKEITYGFLQLFLDLGTEKKFVDQWNKLIEMRFKEYHEHLKAAVKESSSWKELKGDEEVRQTWARIETITIDCLTHIRRGDVKKDDPLWKLLRKWFISLEAQISPIAKLGEEENLQN
ncbi:MAG: hypothetical protein HW400_37 [Candidatus Levybacteria bacterium]|nr:hypothetical protein [Candidatus Levybacteria bacterium]